MLALTMQAPLTLGVELTLPTQGVVNVPDQRSTDLERCADNTASEVLQRIYQMLRKRTAGADSPVPKRQRLVSRDADNDVHVNLDIQSIEPQTFDPSLDREDKEEFNLIPLFGLFHIRSNTLGEIYQRRRGLPCLERIQHQMPR